MVLSQEFYFYITRIFLPLEKWSFILRNSKKAAQKRRNTTKAVEGYFDLRHQRCFCDRRVQPPRFSGEGRFLSLSVTSLRFQISFIVFNIVYWAYYKTDWGRFMSNKKCASINTWLLEPKNQKRLSWWPRRRPPHFVCIAQRAPSLLNKSHSRIDSSKRGSFLIL